MYNRLIHHIHTNNTLGPEQFGFRKGTATEDVALKLRDCVLKWVYPKVYVGGTFCDLVQTLVQIKNFLSKLHFTVFMVQLKNGSDSI
jgi:hypothetical protein